LIKPFEFERKHSNQSPLTSIFYFLSSFSFFFLLYSQNKSFNQYQQGLFYIANNNILLIMDEEMQQRRKKARIEDSIECLICGLKMGVRLFQFHFAECLKTEKTGALQLRKRELKEKDEILENGFDEVPEQNLEFKEREFLEQMKQSQFHSENWKTSESVDDLEIINFIKQEKKKLDGTTILLKLLAFYEQGRSISCDYLKKINVINLAHGGTLLGKNDQDKRSPVLSAKKAFSRIMRKRQYGARTIVIKAGPFGDARADCLLTFRPFLSLLSIWLNDSRWLNLGYLPSSPLPPPNNGFRSYSEAQQYRDIHAGISRLNPQNKFFLLPLLFWTDSVQLSQARKFNSTAHIVMFCCPLASPSMINGDGGMQILGFIGENNLNCSRKSSNGTHLRQQLTSKSLALIFAELSQCQNEGGALIRWFGKNQRVIPYISHMAGDSVEAKRVVCSRGCPFCFALRSKKYEDRSNKFTFGEILSCLEIENLTHMEIEQENMRTGSLEHNRLRNSFSKGIRPILNFRERLDLGGWMEMAPSMPDGLHTLLLGECKRLLGKLYLSLNKENRRRFEKRIKGIPSFPKVLINTERKISCLAVEISCATALIPIVLFEGSFFDPQENRRFCEIFDCLGLLIIGISQDYLSIEDVNNIKDALYVLEGLTKYIYGDDSIFEINHILHKHLFEETIMARFGVPKGYSTSRFEAGLSKLKRSYTRACNHQAGWRSTLLSRATYGTILSQNLNKETIFDPSIPPKFELFINLENQSGNLEKISLNFCDSNRENTFHEANVVKIQTMHRKRTENRNCVLQVKTDGVDAFGFVSKIEARMNGVCISEPGSYIVNNPGFTCVIELEILKPNKENLKHAPDPKLWQCMEKTKRKQYIQLVDIVGTCYSHISKDIIWVGSPFISHIFMRNGQTLVQVPDKRFQ
jgi:hypothetical protein